jgi:hypothetical protein
MSKSLGKTLTIGGAQIKLTTTTIGEKLPNPERRSIPPTIEADALSKHHILETVASRAIFPMPMTVIIRHDHPILTRTLAALGVRHCCFPFFS